VTTNTFYDDIPPRHVFAELMESRHDLPVPRGGRAGVPDVRGSTKALAACRGKDINLVGTATIPSAQNAQGRPLPFVLGEDGSQGGYAFAALPLKAQAAAPAAA
jgi:hypothetical protein